MKLLILPLKSASLEVQSPLSKWQLQPSTYSGQTFRVIFYFFFLFHFIYIRSAIVFAPSLQHIWKPSLCSTFLVTTWCKHHYFLLDHCKSLPTGLPLSSLPCLACLPPSRQSCPCIPKSEHTTPPSPPPRASSFIQSKKHRTHNDWQVPSCLCLQQLPSSFLQLLTIFGTYMVHSGLRASAFAAPLRYSSSGYWPCLLSHLNQVSSKHHLATDLPWSLMCNITFLPMKFSSTLLNLSSKYLQLPEVLCISLLSFLFFHLLQLEWKL